MTLLCTLLFIVGVLGLIGTSLYQFYESRQRCKYFTTLTRRLFRKTGMVYLQCTRIYGVFFERPVLLIVDTGATDNFISEPFVADIYPEYKNHIELGDDIISVHGTETLNQLLNVPIHITPDLNCKDHFSLLTAQESFEYLTQESNYQVVGIVGTEFLNKHTINIEFDNL